MKNNNNSGAVPVSAIVRLLAPVLLAALIGALTLTAFLHHQQQQRLLTQQQLHSQQLAQRLAAWAGQQLVDSQAQLATLAARSDINLALARGNTAPLNRFQQQWLSNAQVQLILPQQLPENLSFSAQQMIRATSAEQTPPPTLIAGQPPRLLLTQASENGTGILLLEQPLEQLQQLFDPAMGQLQLSYQGQPLLALGSGNKAITASSSAQGMTIQVALPAPKADLTLPLIAAAAALALVLLACLWLARDLNRRLRQDSASLIRYAETLAQQPGTQPPKTLNFPVLGALNPALQSLAGQSSTPLKNPSNQSKPPTTAAPKDNSALDMVINEPDTLLSNHNALPDSLIYRDGLYGIPGATLSTQSVYLFGRALASEAAQAGQNAVFVAHDARLSSEELSHALIKGITEAGSTAIDLGLAPAPLLHYATATQESQTGLYIGGDPQHPRRNGIKGALCGQPLQQGALIHLQQRIHSGDLQEGSGEVLQRDIQQRYLQDLQADIALARPFKIAIDSGNGTCGALAGNLFEALGCEVVSLFADSDGHFPNHLPEPSDPQALSTLISTVQQQQLDLGLAFSGDGNRLSVVTRSGEIIWADRLLMLFARDLLSRSPGADIIFDVECSRALPATIRKHGGRPVMHMGGHAAIRSKLLETGAPLGGDRHGHLCFADRWFGVDDALYAAARLLEILSLQDGSSDQVFAELNTGLSTPKLHIPVAEKRKAELIQGLSSLAEQFTGGRAITLDGLRIEYPDGWGLVRAAEHEPALEARFEGRTEEALEMMKQRFRKQLEALDSNLALPF